ncbi:rho GTPase-activating protein 15 isoform X1 [Tachysurus ichikawai]
MNGEISKSSELPRYSYTDKTSLRSLTCHSPVSLCRVLTKSQQNRMSTQGVSIVFGPTLMWPELDAGNMAVNMLYQNQIVEFMLIECVEIFGPESK